MSLFFRPKSIKPEGFTYPKEFILFREKKGFDNISPLWCDLFSDTFKFIDSYDLLLRKYPNKKYIPFAYAIDNSGIFNDGYPIISAFSTLEGEIFIYDINNEYSGFNNRGNFSHSIYQFENWVKFAFDSYDEFQLLHLNNKDE